MSMDSQKGNRKLQRNETLDAVTRHPGTKLAKLVKDLEERMEYFNLVLLMEEILVKDEYVLDFGIHISYYVDKFMDKKTSAFNEAAKFLDAVVRIYGRRLENVYDRVMHLTKSLAMCIEKEKRKHSPESLENQMVAKVVKDRAKRAVCVDGQETEMSIKRIEEMPLEKLFCDIAEINDATSNGEVPHYFRTTDLNTVLLRNSLMSDVIGELNDSKRNYKVFSWNIEHQYNTIMPDSNFRCHLLIHDYIGDENISHRTEFNISEIRLTPTLENSANSNGINQSGTNGVEILNSYLVPDQYLTRCINLENQAAQHMLRKNIGYGGDAISLLQELDSSISYRGFSNLMTTPIERADFIQSLDNSIQLIRDADSNESLISATTISCNFVNSTLITEGNQDVDSLELSTTSDAIAALTCVNTTANTVEAEINKMNQIHRSSEDEGIVLSDLEDQLSPDMLQDHDNTINEDDNDGRHKTNEIILNVNEEVQFDPNFEIVKNIFQIRLPLLKRLSLFRLPKELNLIKKKSISRKLLKEEECHPISVLPNADKKYARMGIPNLFKILNNLNMETETCSSLSDMPDFLGFEDNNEQSADVYDGTYPQHIYPRYMSIVVDDAMDNELQVTEDEGLEDPEPATNLLTEQLGNNTVSSVSGNNTMAEICDNNETSLALNKQRIDDHFYNLTETEHRIREWHIQLAPSLAAAHARQHFSVYNIGTKIIDKLQSGASNMADIMADEDPTHVSRVFLSLLMLTNQGNVTLDPGVRSMTEPTECSKLNIHLISEIRHKIAPEDDIGAPDICPTQSATSVKKVTKRKPTDELQSSAAKPSKILKLANEKYKTPTAEISDNLNMVRTLQPIPKAVRSDETDSGYISIDSISNSILGSTNL